MRFHLLLPIFASTAMALTMPLNSATAAVIDFALLTNSGDYSFAGNPYFESGFRFQNELPFNEALFSWGGNNARLSADPTGGTAIMYLFGPNPCAI